MVQRTARGSLILFLGKITSTLVAALGAILVARFLGATKYGQVTVAMVPISIATLFGDVGVTSALIKYIAQYSSEKKVAETRVMMRVGLLLNSAVGAVLSLITFCLAGILSSDLFHQPELTILIKFASATVLAQSVLLTSRSIFIGFERMELHSLTMIAHSVLRSMLAPLLVYIGFGAVGAILGETSTVVVTGALAVIIVGAVFFREDIRGGGGLGHLQACRLLLDFGYPLFLSVLFQGALLRFYDFLMAVYIDTSMVGNYRAALNFSVLISFLTMPITTVLFPLFSKLDEGESDMLRLVFQNSVKYAALVTVPATLAMMVLSGQLINIVYGNSYAFAPFFLRLYMIDFLFVGLGRIVSVNLVKGQGKTKVNFLMQIIHLGIGLPLSIILIPRYGIIGLILTMVVAQKPGLFFVLWWVKKNFGFTLNWVASAKIFLSGGLASLATSSLLFFLNTWDWVDLVIGGCLFFLIYSLLIPLTGVLERSDIRNLRNIMEGLGPLTSLFKLFLSVVEMLTSRTGTR